MENPGYITLSRQLVLRRQMDIVANNLANMNTPAYKRESMLFVEHLKRTPDGEQISFVQDIAVSRDPSEGAMIRTGNPLDVAIRGEGYFVIDAPEGERYLRAGNFSLDEEGRIVTSHGYPVLDEGGGAIFVPPGSGDVTIAPDGTVQSDRRQIGHVQVVKFDSELALRKVRSGLYVSDSVAQPVDQVAVQQGMLEASNVSGVVEITRMIETVRNYQAAARIAEDENRRQRQAIETLGRTRA